MSAQCNRGQRAVGEDRQRTGGNLCFHLALCVHMCVSATGHMCTSMKILPFHEPARIKPSENNNP